MNLIKELDYSPGQIANKVIAKNDSGMVILMALDKDMAIATHTAHAIAVVQILEGVCVFTINGEERLLNAGDYLVMQPETQHSLRAPQRFKMLLTKLNA